jgi:L-asparaginase
VSKPKVAFIGTGGTISSLGVHPLELQDYGVHNNRLQASGIVERFPTVQEIAEVIAVDFRNVPSTDIYFAEWQELAGICGKLAKQYPDLAGIVIGHGTATLEETAYFLNLVLKVPFPVVLIGAQRPASGLSTDAAINLVNGVRVAADPASRGRGVLTMLNDEIQAAREVTKTSNWRMQTFRTPDFGALGHADADRIAYYRKPERRHMPDTEFDVAGLEALPRVDIAYAYAGSDGSAMRAFIAAGARGLVSAGFAPGMPPAADLAAMAEAVRQGIVVVQSSRAGSGRIYRSQKLADAGVLAADNLNPQKARLLLALALTRTSDPAEIARIFATY